MTQAIGDFLFDLAYPSTDRAVYIQWIVAGVFWAIVLWMIRRLERDYRHFIWGIFMMNLAWFAFRAVH